jgi:hypothetical protein
LGALWQENIQLGSQTELSRLPRAQAFSNPVSQRLPNAQISRNTVLFRSARSAFVLENESRHFNVSLKWALGELSKTFSEQLPELGQDNLI